MSQPNANVKNYVIENAKVLKVMTPTQDDNRVSLVLDKTFKTVDFVTGEEKDTNILGINIYNLTSQVNRFVEEIQVADTLAMGKMVNPKIIALALTNAVIDVNREYHEAGEARKETNDTYSSNCYSSTITSCKPHITNMFAAMISKLIIEEPAVVRTTGSYDTLF